MFQALINGGQKVKRSGGQAVIGGQSPRKEICHCQRVKRPSQSQNITLPLYSPPLKGGDMEHLSPSRKDKFNFCSGTLPKRTYRPSALASYRLIQSKPHPIPLFPPLPQYLLNFKIFEQVFTKEREENKFLPLIGKVRMGFKQYPPLTPSLIREGENNSPIRTYSPIDLLTFSLKKKTAFTLAEVLITLGIISIVAALTIPQLIVKHQKKLQPQN